MRMDASSVLIFGAAAQGETVQPGKNIALDKALGFYRVSGRRKLFGCKQVRKNRAESSQRHAPVVAMGRAKSLRIRVLEAELAHYRCMLEKMVCQRTGMLERRVSILESCNATLGVNYHKMHKMYLDLLLKTQE